MKNPIIPISSISLLCVTSPAIIAQQKPNVVLIVVDDMGWKDLGVYGSDFHQTPQIDNLATDAVRFSNAYSACTVSSPTRASIMTGKYPAKLHLTDWIEGHKMPKAKLQIPDWTMYLPLEETTLAEVFKSNGYTTAHIGKWHLGENQKYWPENQGFDINIAGCAKGSPTLDKKQGLNGYFVPYGNPRMKDGPEGEYLTERLTNEACNYIQQSQSKPFFLNLWFYNVHTPLQAKQDKIDKYKALVDSTKLHKNPIYAAMVEHVDDAVGKVVAQLKSLGLYDNTIIIFTSDNGGLIGNKKNQVTNNSPLRLGKGERYEGGVRVPLIIKTVKQAAANRQENTPVMSIDFMPTLIDLANLIVDKKVKKGIDGVDIKPLLLSKACKLNKRVLYWHYPHYHTEGATPYSAIRDGDWKLIHTIETNSYELFNLKNDISESKNLYDSEPAIAAKLIKELESWKKDMKAQMPTVKVVVK
jgi:arylsulfatase A-like enzyme